MPQSTYRSSETGSHAFKTTLGVSETYSETGSHAFKTTLGVSETSTSEYIQY